MRLVCPNCEAKYEVPDDAIPDTGRDVQCANCGHAWFQMRNKALGALPETAPESAAEPAADPTPEGDAQTVAANIEQPTPPHARPAEPDEVTQPEPVADALDEFPEPTTVSDEPATSMSEPSVEAGAEPGSSSDETTDEDLTKGPAPYAVDDSVLAILREEAQREALARKAESRPLEDQPDLGLDSGLVPTKKPAAFLMPDEPPGKASARRDLLPDVEEINSTLRPSEQPVEDDAENLEPVVETRRAGGFRSGFLLVMTLAILGTAVYVAAPTLGNMVPSLAEPLNTYVSAIDNMRLQLDGLMKSATVAINGEG